MGWVHAICDDCYAAREPGKEPVRVSGDPKMCCFCGVGTDSGISYRAHPESAPWCPASHD